jgi:MFS family permease
MIDQNGQRGAVLATAPRRTWNGTGRRPLLALALATAVGSTGLAAGGTAGALLGAELTNSQAAVGLPLGLLVVGQAASSLLVSRWAAEIGRGRSLALGYLLGAVGAALVVAAAAAASLGLLCLGSVVLGAGNAAVFMARYAAAAVGGMAARGRALGVVLFATALGAVASPGLLGPSGELAERVGLPSLAGLYLIAIAGFMAAAILLSIAPDTGGPRVVNAVERGGPTGERRGTWDEMTSGMAFPAVRAAIAILAAANLVMVAVMATVPVHLIAHGHGLGLVGVVVSLHVAAMFGPSPVSGWAADRFGPATVAGGGFLLILASGAVGAVLETTAVLPMAVVLTMLGFGWNLGVVGGSALLVSSALASLRPHVEGIGEVAMGLAAGAGAPIAGLVLALWGVAGVFLAGTALTAGMAIALARRPDGGRAA